MNREALCSLSNSQTSHKHSYRLNCSFLRQLVICWQNSTWQWKGILVKPQSSSVIRARNWTLLKVVLLLEICTSLRRVCFVLVSLIDLAGLVIRLIYPPPSIMITLLFLESRDPEKALRYLEKACDGNSAGACGNAGLLYQNGLEGTCIKKDISKSMDLFQKACELGAKNGCFNLSIVYLTGASGIPKDMAKAFDMSVRSCNMGHSWACANVSRMYSLGEGIARNPREAERFKKRAQELHQELK